MPAVPLTGLVSRKKPGGSNRVSKQTTMNTTWRFSANLPGKLRSAAPKFPAFLLEDRIPKVCLANLPG